MRKLIIIIFLFACSYTAFCQEEGVLVISTKQQQAQQYFNQALSFYQQKKYDTALNYINNALKIDFFIAEAYILKANLQQETGQLQDAITTWLIFADKTGKKDSAYYMVSKLYFDSKNYDSSLKYAQMAIDIDSLNYKTHYLKGLNNYNLEKQEDAINSFSTAISLKETVAELYNDRGNAYYKIKNFQSAIEDYTEAIRLKPIYSYYYNLANVEFHAGDFQKAVDNYTTAIQLDKNNCQLYCNRGIAKLALSDLYEALEDFQTCILIDNTFPQGYDYRGLVYFRLKRYEDAMNDFNKALNLNPQSAKTYLHRGNTYEMLREPQKACQDWQQAATRGIKEAQEYINNQCK